MPWDLRIAVEGTEQRIGRLEMGALWLPKPLPPHRLKSLKFLLEATRR